MSDWILKEPAIPYGKNKASYIASILSHIRTNRTDIEFLPNYLFELFAKEETMIKKQEIEVKQKFNFSWEGGLKELKKEFNGVTLQHYVNTLRK